MAQSQKVADVCEPVSGLYVHIPFCRALCHYCDFAKTANYDDSVTNRYFRQLQSHLQYWLEELALREGGSAEFQSVFFGGGTPSLFGKAYAPLFELLRPHLASQAEVTMEANPDDLTPDRLAELREVGINRLSIGVQSFDPRALGFLKRTHDGEAAEEAVRHARRWFPRVNVDLIYGWPGQSEAGWKDDLRRAVALEVDHLSLYTLTYEPRTPIGRAAQRGRIDPAPDESLVEAYETARTLLEAAGFEHLEVSNWARPGAGCRHNRLYWTDQPYLGVGSGAHGYFRFSGGIGTRYAYGRGERFLGEATQDLDGRSSEDPPATDWGRRTGVHIEADRSRESWLLEYLGAALRHREGVDLARAEAVTGRLFQPTPVLEEALAQGILHVTPARRLVLEPGSWIRETAWALAVAEAFGS